MSGFRVLEFRDQGLGFREACGSLLKGLGFQGFRVQGLQDWGFIDGFGLRG